MKSYNNTIKPGFTQFNFSKINGQRENYHQSNQGKGAKGKRSKKDLPQGRKGGDKTLINFKAKDQRSLSEIQQEFIEKNIKKDKNLSNNVTTQQAPKNNTTQQELLNLNGKVYSYPQPNKTEHDFTLNLEKISKNENKLGYQKKTSSSENRRESILFELQNKKNIGKFQEFMSKKSKGAENTLKELNKQNNKFNSSSGNNSRKNSFKISDQNHMINSKIKKMEASEGLTKSTIRKGGVTVHSDMEAGQVTLQAQNGDPLQRAAIYDKAPGVTNLKNSPILELTKESGKIKKQILSLRCVPETALSNSAIGASSSKLSELSYLHSHSLLKRRRNGNDNEKDIKYYQMNIADLLKPNNKDKDKNKRIIYNVIGAIDLYSNSHKTTFVGKIKGVTQKLPTLEQVLNPPRPESENTNNNLSKDQIKEIIKIIEVANIDQKTKAKLSTVQEFKDLLNFNNKDKDKDKRIIDNVLRAVGLYFKSRKTTFVEKVKGATQEPPTLEQVLNPPRPENEDTNNNLSKSQIQEVLTIVGKYLNSMKAKGIVLKNIDPVLRDDLETQENMRHLYQVQEFKDLWQSVSR